MDNYPYVTATVSSSGKVLYRFRRKGFSFYLPFAPGHPEFEKYYQAALDGRRLPGMKPKASRPFVPESFADAWRLVKKTAEWKRYDPATKYKNTTLTEMFLFLEVAPGLKKTWGEIRISDLKRRHARDILARFSETPHKAKHLLTAIRRLIKEALDQDWIEFDPTQKIGWRPDYTGWRAWTAAERKQFELRWPNGTTPRAAYAIALWLGLRRGDVATLRWEDVDFVNKRVTLTVGKTTARGNKTLRLLMLPMLEKALIDLPRRCDTVLSTEYGKPFSDKSLTGLMANWTRMATMKPGATFHGLRKTLGKYLAECGATAKQSAGILGHDDLDHVELYSREADQETLAVAGLSLLLERFSREGT